MARGTFANTRLIYKIVEKLGPQTIFDPSCEKIAIYDAVEKSIASCIDTIILAAKEYGSGSSRDWAGKGSSFKDGKQ